MAKISLTERAETFVLACETKKNLEDIRELAGNKFSCNASWNLDHFAFANIDEMIGWLKVKWLANSFDFEITSSNKNTVVSSIIRKPDKLDLNISQKVVSTWSFVFDEKLKVEHLTLDSQITNLKD